jgi:hypothetical protein
MAAIKISACGEGAAVVLKVWVRYTRTRRAWRDPPVRIPYLANDARKIVCLAVTHSDSCIILKEEECHRDANNIAPSQYHSPFALYGDPRAPENFNAAFGSACNSFWGVAFKSECAYI